MHSHRAKVRAGIAAHAVPTGEARGQDTQKPTWRLVGTAHRPPPTAHHRQVTRHSHTSDSSGQSMIGGFSVSFLCCSGFLNPVEWAYLTDGREKKKRFTKYNLKESS